MFASLRKIPMLFCKSPRDALLHGHQKVSANSLYRRQRTTTICDLLFNYSRRFCHLDKCFVFITLAFVSPTAITSSRHNVEHFPHLTRLDTLSILARCVFLEVRLSDSERDSDLITPRWKCSQAWMNENQSFGSNRKQ